MPKSYKICLSNHFATQKFSGEPYYLNEQLHIEGVEPPPSTLIYKALGGIDYLDFSTYTIEHELEQDILCRIGSKTYSKIIRKCIIKTYYSKGTNLLLLSGKKADIWDFCRKTNDFQDVKLSTIKVDMKKLLRKLASVKLVWFNFPQGPIHASALMGSGVERTPDFKKYKEIGDISTLSFHFEILDSLHPVMVTGDGAVVLQENYENISDEVKIVIMVKKELLDGIYEIDEQS